MGSATKKTRLSPYSALRAGISTLVSSVLPAPMGPSSVTHSTLACCPSGRSTRMALLSQADAAAVLTASNADDAEVVKDMGLSLCTIGGADKKPLIFSIVWFCPPSWTAKQVKLTARLRIQEEFQSHQLACCERRTGLGAVIRTEAPHGRSHHVDHGVALVDRGWAAAVPALDQFAGLQLRQWRVRRCIVDIGDSM